MTAPPPPPSPSAHDVDAGERARVAEPDRLCLRCGYELFGLPLDGHCPECGAAVADSMRGRLLRNAHPDYVRSIDRGLVLILIGSILAFIVGIASSVFSATAGFQAGTPAAVGPPAAPSVIVIAPDGAAESTAAPNTATGTAVPAPAPGTGTGTAPAPGGPLIPAVPRGTFVYWVSIAAIWIGVAVELLLVVGWWKFTTPDPTSRAIDIGEGTRRFIRSTVVAVAIVTGISVFLADATVARPGGVGWLVAVLLYGVSVLMKVARFFAAMLYLAWLAPRIPDERVARLARRYLWLVPVLFVGLTGLLIATSIGILVAIRNPAAILWTMIPSLTVGPLIAIVLTWLLLFRVHRRFRAIIRGETGPPTSAPGLMPT